MIMETYKVSATFLNPQQRLSYVVKYYGGLKSSATLFNLVLLKKWGQSTKVRSPIFSSLRVSRYTPSQQHIHRLHDTCHFCRSHVNRAENLQRFISVNLEFYIFYFVLILKQVQHGVQSNKNQDCPKI